MCNFMKILLNLISTVSISESDHQDGIQPGRFHRLFPHRGAQYGGGAVSEAEFWPAGGVEESTFPRWPWKNIKYSFDFLLTFDRYSDPC